MTWTVFLKEVLKIFFLRVQRSGKQFFCSITLYLHSSVKPAYASESERTLLTCSCEKRVLCLYINRGFRDLSSKKAQVNVNRGQRVNTEVNLDVNKALRGQVKLCLESSLQKSILFFFPPAYRTMQELNIHPMFWFHGHETRNLKRRYFVTARMQRIFFGLTQSTIGTMTCLPTPPMHRQRFEKDNSYRHLHL